MSGWREDFDLSNTFPVPSQKLAAEYLISEAKKHDKIYVGGHSKGGNLAVAAALQADEKVREKIITVYDFDGPGFREKEFNSESFQKLIPKIKKYTPEVSVVGMILYSTPNYIVVKSNYKGILQHHAMSWQCFGSYFIPAKQSKNSIKFNNSIKEFLKNNTEEELKEFVKAIFEDIAQAKPEKIEEKQREAERKRSEEKEKKQMEEDRRGGEQQEKKDEGLAMMFNELQAEADTLWENTKQSRYESTVQSPDTDLSWSEEEEPKKTEQLDPTVTHRTEDHEEERT